MRVSLPVSGLTLYSVPPPASGVVLGTILGTLDGYRFSNASLASDSAQAQTLHNITETFKFAYAMRSLLGDADFTDVEEVGVDEGRFSAGEVSEESERDEDFPSDLF